MKYQKPVVVPVSKALISTAAGIAATIGVLTSEPALGATVTYDFVVDVYEGAYIGKYNGSFSYDGSTALIPCLSGGVLASCATTTDNNLTVQFNFLGNTYTEKQEYDIGYPRVFFPLSATSGGLSFLVVSPSAPVGFFFVGNTFQIGNTEGDNPYDGVEVGKVNYTLRPPDPQPEPPPPDDGGAVAVPEPSEVAGSVLALGLLGIGWYWRRSKTTAINLDKDHR